MQCGKAINNFYRFENVHLNLNREIDSIRNKTRFFNEQERIGNEIANKLKRAKYIKK